MTLLINNTIGHYIIDYLIGERTEIPMSAMQETLPTQPHKF